MSVSSFKEENKKIFKGASMKMKMMIFKRNVYESRRRPKGILRPKNKPSLKEISQVRIYFMFVRKMKNDVLISKHDEAFMDAFSF